MLGRIRCVQIFLELRDLKKSIQESCYVYCRDQTVPGTVFVLRTFALLVARWLKTRGTLLYIQQCMEVNSQMYPTVELQAVHSIYRNVHSGCCTS